MNEYIFEPMHFWEVQNIPILGLHFYEESLEFSVFEAFWSNEINYFDNIFHDLRHGYATPA